LEARNARVFRNETKFEVQFVQDNHSPAYAQRAPWLALSVLYKTTDYYASESERCLIWNDPEVGITWPLNSERCW
jgi:dTDP-4-dehydrorhamnose 3,5-epimerase-like enzyme